MQSNATDYTKPSSFIAYFLQNNIFTWSLRWLKLSEFECSAQERMKKSNELFVQHRDRALKNNRYKNTTQKKQFKILYGREIAQRRLRFVQNWQRRWWSVCIVLSLAVIFGWTKLLWRQWTIYSAKIVMASHEQNRL